MWIVYNKEDSPSCGWAVESEAEAIRQCEEDSSLTYKYVYYGGGYYEM